MKHDSQKKVILSIAIAGACIFGCKAHHINDEVSESLSKNKNSHQESSQPLQSKFGMNDVSILLPLPATADLGLLPGLTVGDHNAMVSFGYFSRLPALVELQGIGGVSFPPNPINQDLIPELRVVAVRFDPCFRDAPNVGACQPQMRLVVQSVQRQPGIGFSSRRDLAIHLFYRITITQLKSALNGLAEARGHVEGLAQIPLSVNPTLKTQGLDGAYGKELKKRISRLAKSHRLVRMAFTAIGGVGNAWTFGSFDIANGMLKVVKIPNIEASETIRFSLSSQFNSPHSFDGSLTPKPMSGDNAGDVVRHLPVELPAPEREITKMLKIENPTLHGPGTVDCVSCHIAMTVRSLLSSPDGMTIDFSTQYKSVWSTIVTGEMETDQTGVRAFGYKGETIGISQRVVNETAAVLEYLAEPGTNSNGSPTTGSIH